MMRWLAKRMVIYRYPMFFGCLVASAILYLVAGEVPNDRSIRSFFDQDNPRLAVYDEMESTFGGDTMCFAVYADPNLLSREGIARLAGFSAKLRQVPGVLATVSLAELRRPSKSAVSPRPLAEWFADPKSDPDVLRKEVLECELFARQFFGEEGRIANVVILVDPAFMETGRLQQTVKDIRAIAADYDARFVGSPVLINDVFDNMEKDARLLARVSLVANLAVIYVLFRSVRWVVLPLLIVQCSLVWTHATMWLGQMQLGFTGAMSTSLLVVIGIAESVHIAVRYREDFDRQGSPLEALEETLVHVLPATFWTVATTSMGFAALMVSTVAPIRDFGIVMAAASAYVGIVAFLLIPGGVTLGRLAVRPGHAPGEPALSAGLGVVERWAVNHSYATAGAVTALLALLGVGMAWVRVETDFTQNFRNNSPILESYTFVEDRLGGIGIFGMAFDAPERLTPQFLDQVRQCETAIRELPGVVKATTLTDFLDFIDSSLGSGPISANPLLLNLQIRTLKQAQPREVAQTWNDVERQMRIVLRVRERQSSGEKTVLLDRIESAGRQLFGDSVKVTGLYVLLVHLIENLLQDQWRASIASAIGLYGMMWLAFRNWRMALVAFLPNLIPIVLIAGTMGWLGIKLNAATCMINSMSMGLTIDCAIHYLYRYQEERRAGGDYFAAINLTHQNTGIGMVFATLALMLGFSVLVLSNFVPMMQFGLLVSLAMFGGLLGNLALLPVLLRLFDRDRPASARPKAGTSRRESDRTIA